MPRISGTLTSPTSAVASIPDSASFLAAGAEGTAVASATGFCLVLKALGVRVQFGSGRVAAIADGFEGFADDPEELRRKVAIAALASVDTNASIRFERHHGAVFGERQPTGRHFVQHDAKTEDIAAGVHVEASRLLRRHVTRSADHHPRLRAGFHVDLIDRLHRGRELRDPEVENLRVAVWTHNDVVGLDVTVHEAAGMRGRQRTRQLDADLYDLAHRQGALLQPTPQGLTLDELGHDVRTAIQLAKIVDDDDVGVVQTRRGSRFLTEPS